MLTLTLTPHTLPMTLIWNRSSYDVIHVYPFNDVNLVNMWVTANLLCAIRKEMSLTATMKS